MKNSKTGASKGASAGKVGKERFVYSFGDGKADGREDQKNLLGGKGANLHGMTTARASRASRLHDLDRCLHLLLRARQELSEGARSAGQARRSLSRKVDGPQVRRRKNPLLVSVRSGARASMPGMMDTILNLGLNDETVQGLIEESPTPDSRASPTTAIAASSRCTRTSCSNIHANQFESALEDMKHARGVELDTELTAEDLKELVGQFKQIVRTRGQALSRRSVGAALGRGRRRVRLVDEPARDHLPQAQRNPRGVGHCRQRAVHGVRQHGRRLRDRRRLHARSFDRRARSSSASSSSTPKAKTSSPASALRSRSTKPRGTHDAEQDLPTLEEVMPKAYGELVKVYQKLEKHYRDMQDIEFTIERGKLFMLQTRNGKRTAAAALSIAVEMVREKLITRRRGDPPRRARAARPAPASDARPQGQKRRDRQGPARLAGRGHGPNRVRSRNGRKMGQRTGQAKSSWCASKPRPKTSTACRSREGILTARGGMTSHAAVVARGMGKCCVSGCSAHQDQLRAQRIASSDRQRSDPSRKATSSLSTARQAK